MRNVILFIAMSLDGYLADRRGGVDWLRGQDPGAEDPDSYAPFSQRVDTVLMGWNTYHQIITELSPGTWVYSGMTSYVFTHRELPPPTRSASPARTPAPWCGHCGSGRGGISGPAAART